MKKLDFWEMVTLSVALSARIEQLERFYAKSVSLTVKKGYLQEIEETKKLREMIDKKDLYTE